MAASTSDGRSQRRSRHGRSDFPAAAELTRQEISSPWRKRQSPLTDSAKRRKAPGFFIPESRRRSAAAQFYTGEGRCPTLPLWRVLPLVCYRRFTLDKKNIQAFQCINYFAQILGKALNPAI